MLTLLLILVPLAFSLIVFSVREEDVARKMALAGALAELGLALMAFYRFYTSCHCDLLFSLPELTGTGLGFRIGLDGIGMLITAMTTLLVPVIIYSSFSNRYKNPSAFYGLILLMEMAMVGVFASFDGLWFYIFWELALIPAWFICALWGGTDRIRITFKFFVYTFSGSLFMLVALIWIYLSTPQPHSFTLEWMQAAMLNPHEQAWIFAAFFLAFAIKIPLLPFHTWQPDTYTTSPPAGSMLLAGIMLKMGLFGMLRWMIPLCPDAAVTWAFPVMILGVAGVIYGSVIAIMQQDLKRLIAWSSIAHVGLIAAGIFSLTTHGLQGAVIQMVSHGINITGLFIVADIIERKTGTREISKLGGIALQAPWLGVMFMIVLLGSVALPLTNGFVGEFLLLLGIFEVDPVLAAVAGLTIILGAVYMLWMYQRTMLGTPTEQTKDFTDLTVYEKGALIPLVILILWIGIFPGLFLDTSLNDILELLGKIK